MTKYGQHVLFERGDESRKFIRRADDSHPARWEHSPRDPDRARQEARQVSPRARSPTDLPSQLRVGGHRSAVVRAGLGLPSSASWRARNRHAVPLRLSAKPHPWTDDRWQHRPAGRILTTSGSDARMRIVESNEAERIANELAALLAQEHRRVVHEQAKREAAEATASDLAVQLALDRTELERERQARERAEAQASELSTLIIGDVEEERAAARFIPAPRSGNRRFQRLQRVS
jgi:hypothetical protein